MKRLTPFWTGSGTLLILLAFSIGLTVQKDNDVVNILFIHQDVEWKKVFDIAMKYLVDKGRDKFDPTVKIGKIHEYNASMFNDSVKLTVDFCETYNKLIKGDDKPDIAIDFTRIGPISEGIKILLAAVQLPTIAATYGQEGDVREWRDLELPKQKNLIQVSPPADVLVQSVRSIVDKQAMTSAVLLFDEDQFEMYHKYKSLLQNIPARHLLTKTKPLQNLSEQIEHLIKVDIVNFFIAGKVKQISEVLMVASRNRSAKQQEPYFSDEYAWYSMTLVPGEKAMPQCNCEMNVSLVHLIPEDFKKGHKRKEYLDKALSKSDTNQLSLSEMFYFDMAVDAVLAMATLKKNSSYKFNIGNRTCVFKAKDNKMSKKYDLYPSQFFKAFSDAVSRNGLPIKLEGKTGKNYPLFDLTIRRLLYSTADKTRPYDNVVVGKWEPGFGEQSQVKFIPPKDLTAHLAHTVFRIVTYVQPPFVIRLPNCSNEGKGNKYKNCFEGYCIDLLERIQGDLKFKYTIREVKDGYGYMNETFPHDWNGMVGELFHRRADIALGAMSVMAERESVVDFTVPYYDLVGISILMKKPVVATSLFKFLTVLENDVWMSILGSYFFTSILLWIFDRWSPYSYQNNREKYEDDEEKREFTLKECLWFCMTSLTPQGGGESPKNLSGRLVAATWWLFGFIIIASYTANLAAFLTVSRLDTPVESLDDLIKQYRVQYAPMKNSSAWIYFDRMRNIEKRFYNIWKNLTLNDSIDEYDKSRLAVWDYPVSDKYSRMWAAMQENKPPETFEAAVERVRAINRTDPSMEPDGFAFLEEATNVKWEALLDCTFESKGEEFSRKPYAIAVQKGSPLKESISHMILKLLNQRVLEHFKEQWWTENPHKAQCPKDEAQADGISIHNIGGVFIVIFVGIIMACFTLLFEYWWNKKRDVTEELADMTLPPPKDFGSKFTTSTPPTIEKTNFNTQYDKPPERMTLPSIENAW